MKSIDKTHVTAEFGVLIKEAREKKGLVHAEVAKQLGISRTYYTMIENGKRDIYFSTAIALCCILDLNIGDLKKLLK